MALTKVQGEGISGVSISANNEITMSSQPAFQARLASNQNNIAVDSQVTILYASETFDVNSDYNNSTYTFTAPVTGKYQLNMTLRLQNIDTDHDYVQLKLVTSNREYEMHIVDCGVFDQDSAYQTFNGSVLVDMDASDTAYLQIRAVGGTAQTDISYGGDSHWTGYLAC